jgi:hypothetical protein
VLTLAMFWPPAHAESFGDLYSVSVPYAGDNDAAFREAMRDVLVRVTGRRDAPDLENLAPLVAQASRYVTSFRRAPGNQLAVTFDGAAIENVIDASGLASLGNDRPVTLVWLALDRGGGRRAMVSSSDTSAEKSAVDAIAARRGLPVVWPDAGDDLVRATQQVWSGNHDALQDAARRYGADAVLVGPRASHGREYLRGGLAVLVGGANGSATGGLEAGPGPRGRALCKRYASRGAAQRTEQIVTVTGIASLEAYASAMRTLSKARPVRGVAGRRGDARRVSVPGQRARRPGGAQPGDPARRPPTGRGRRAPDLRAVSMKLATVPNIICLLRMALTVPIVVLLAEGRFGQTLALFAVAAASDVLDGVSCQDLRLDL